MVTAVALPLASQEAFLSVVAMRTNTDERQDNAFEYFCKNYYNIVENMR